MRNSNEDIRNLNKIVHGWPLHLLDTALSMDISHQLNDVTSGLTIVIEQDTSLLNSYEVGVVFEGIVKLKNKLTMLLDFGINFERAEDVMTILDYYEEPVSKKLAAVNRYEANLDAGPTDEEEE